MMRYRAYLKEEPIHKQQCRFPRSFKNDCDKFMKDTKGVYAGSFNHLLEVSTRAFILSKSLGISKRKNK